MNPPDHICLGSPRFPNSLNSGPAAEPPIDSWRRAFSTLGPKAPNTVTGDFAIALREPDGTVFLAVDRFAIRTLCYRMVGDQLHFAERADALADAACELDPQAIYDYLYFHAIPSPRTIFKDVFRVPPGHYVLFKQGKLTVAPYWQAEFQERGRKPLPELKSEFLQVVQDAVSIQLAGGPCGCFMSGGTDSSTVAGMVGRISGQPAETYSIGFDAEGYDEMEYARIAARHFKTNHHEYYVTPDDLVSGIPAVAAHYDQPFGNSSAVPAYYCARMAKADGIAKMLAGDGGDELFGGNTRYAKQRVFGAYDALPSFIRKALIEPVLVDSGVFDSVPLVRKAASYARQARVPMPDRMETYNLIERLGLTEVLTPAFLAAVDTGDPLRQQREVYAGCKSRSLVNRMLAFDWRYTLAENDLPKVCGTADLAGVALGFPLLDDRLLDFSMQLPPHYKVRGVKLRWFFKEALRGFLPDEIIAKKKHGFGLPFGVWAARHAGLGKLASDSLQRLAERGVVRADFIDKLLTVHLPAHPGYYGEMVWILIMLEQWLRAKAPNWRLA
jgi:asparagine synthase (glutamine-hydrolysing)